LENPPWQDNLEVTAQEKISSLGLSKRNNFLHNNKKIIYGRKYLACGVFTMFKENKYD